MSRRPDLAKREVWRRRLLAYDRGTLTAEEFCWREGVSVASFYQWRRKLRDKTDGSLVAPGGRKSVTRQSASPSGFLPVEITGLTASSAASMSCIEVLLPGGPRLLVPCHQQQAIRTVIAALTESSATSLAKIAEQGSRC